MSEFGAGRGSDTTGARADACEEQDEYTQINAAELEELLIVEQAARRLMNGGFKTKTAWRDARRELRHALDYLTDVRGR